MEGQHGERDGHWGWAWTRCRATRRRTIMTAILGVVVGVAVLSVVFARGGLAHLLLALEVVDLFHGGGGGSGWVAQVLRDGGRVRDCPGRLGMAGKVRS
jgi:hypothetical protein